MFLRQDPGLSIPRNDEHRPRGTTQHAFGNRSLSELPPPPSSVGSQNDDIDFPGVGMKHDHAGRITMLLFDAHLHPAASARFRRWVRYSSRSRAREENRTLAGV